MKDNYFGEGCTWFRNIFTNQRAVLQGFSHSHTLSPLSYPTVSTLDSTEPKNLIFAKLVTERGFVNEKEARSYVNIGHRFDNGNIVPSRSMAGLIHVRHVLHRHLSQEFCFAPRELTIGCCNDCWYHNDMNHLRQDPHISPFLISYTNLVIVKYTTRMH